MADHATRFRSFPIYPRRAPEIGSEQVRSTVVPAVAAAFAAALACTEQVGTGPCAGGTFCDTGIGENGGVCLALMPAGAIFGIGTGEVYKTCKVAGGAACITHDAFGANEAHDFQGYCVCGAPPGAACSMNED